MGKQCRVKSGKKQKKVEKGIKPIPASAGLAKTGFPKHLGGYVRMDYLKYWGLKTRPFEGNRSTKFFFFSREHGEALSRLLYMAEDKNMGIGVLTGEIGCGKTLTRTVMENLLDRSKFEIVSLESSDFSLSHLLVEFIDQIAGGALELLKLSKYELLFRFRKILWEDIVSKNKHLVILLDEAQQMEKQTLDELKNLSNLSSEDENYLTIILLGQPELADTLSEMPQVDQRVSLRFHLNFMRRDEVKGYVEHRLNAGGHPNGKLFTDEALELIYKESKGVPRNINRICNLALDQGFSLQAHTIGKEIVLGIVKDIFRQSEPKNREDRWMTASA